MNKKLRATQFIRTLAGKGRFCFTTDEALKALGSNPVALSAALRRLKASKRITTPVRGFHVIISDEYLQLGSLPAEQFIPDMMKYLDQSYYAGLLTAARFHGAGHQAAQAFQVITKINRKPIVSGGITVRFIANQQIEQVATVSFKTPNGYLALSTPEATAVDLLVYPQHSGGLSNIATILSELADKLDPAKLLAAVKLAPGVVYAQRLGYILDVVLKKRKLAETLLPYVKRHAHSLTRLNPSQHCKGAKVNDRWMLLVNSTVEPDL